MRGKKSANDTWLLILNTHCWKSWVKTFFECKHCFGKQIKSISTDNFSLFSFTLKKFLINFVAAVLYIHYPVNDFRFSACLVICYQCSEFSCFSFLPINAFNCKFKLLSFLFFLVSLPKWGFFLTFSIYEIGIFNSIVTLLKRRDKLLRCLGF